MIFNEIYSAYYKAVSNIISKILDGETNERELEKTVAQNAFGESVLTVLPSLKSGKWQLLAPDFTTTLKHKPSTPVTKLQKQWLKAILLDSRIKLFDLKIDGLDGIEPLFSSQDYYVYDKYADGDPFEDEEYIKKFRFFLAAIKDKAPVKINMTNRLGKNEFSLCVPRRLEYSQKDDKFRLLTSGARFMQTVNLSRISSYERYDKEFKASGNAPKTNYRTVVIRITDERNALERCMLHFAHFQKQAEKLDNKHYLVRIKYDVNDETEILIRVLSFGPLAFVVEPQSFVEQIKDRLKKQKNCNLK